MWKAVKWFIGISILASIALTIIEKTNETRSFNELKQSDQAEYLSQLKEKDETRWLLALKELNPKQYTMELKTRVDSARRIPAAKTYENLKAYRDLAKIEPTNETFAEKIEYYENIQATKEAKLKACDSKLKSDAYIYAKEAVKTQLKSPRSAKFGSYGQTRISTFKDCVFEVSGHVDSQNGFGALIRSQYKVQLQGTEQGWTIKNLDIK